MKKAHLSKLFFALMLILLLALVACSDNTGGDSVDNSGNSNDNSSEEGNDEKEGNDEEDDLYSIEDFDNIKNNEGDAIDGG